MEFEDDTLREAPVRRVAPRYIVRIPVLLRVGSSEFDGTIVDISDSGARVECKSLQLAPGTSVALELRWFDGSDRVAMLAKFVRESAAGCALRFVDPDPFLRLFVKLARMHDTTVPGQVREARALLSGARRGEPRHPHFARLRLAARFASLRLRASAAQQLLQARAGFRVIVSGSSSSCAARAR